jgi:hypothetical protein
LVGSDVVKYKLCRPVDERGGGKMFWMERIDIGTFDIVASEGQDFRSRLVTLCRY